MSSFAPVYQPPTHRQSLLSLEQKRERKRKRHAENIDENDSDPDVDHETDLKVEAGLNGTPRVWNPVNKTDPFYVAGLGREEALPGGNFPYASPAKPKEKVAIEEELARLNPPLLVPGVAPDAQDGSLRRRHLDNLTAILHKCMLNQDWDRASRVWGLILRTEVQGRGIDVRHNGRWLIGGEVLMRRTPYSGEQPNGRPSSSHQVDIEKPQVSQTSDTACISDESFRLAREYYERLTLQYPHVPRQRETTVNALAIYPALFNVWIYEVHSRGSSVRHAQTNSSSPFKSETSSESGRSDQREVVQGRRQIRLSIATELQEAWAIAQRMDDLMLNPPYDRSPELLHLRSMVSLWLCDLHGMLTESENTLAESDHIALDEDESTADFSPNTPQNLVEKERATAKKIMQHMLSAGFEVPSQLGSFLEDKTVSYSEEDG